MEQAADYMINVPMSMARRLLANMKPEDGSDYFRMQASIQMGEQAEARRVKAKAEADRLQALREAAELAKPFSQREKSTDEMCGEEFNRLRRMYNLSWQHEYDLESMGGIIIYAYSGEWLGTSWNKKPRNLLEILETVIENGKIGEPFEGPLYIPQDDDDQQAD